MTPEDESPDVHAPDASVAPASARPGLSTFTIEGRAAPGLFVVGWLATILGLGLVLIGAVAPSGFFLYFLGPVFLTVGLVAGAGNQSIERRARGSAYAGPSPYLVLAAMIAAVYAVGSVVGVVLHLLLGGAGVPSYVVNLIGVTLQGLVFVGILRLTVVGSDALSWADMGWRRLDGTQLGHFLFGAALAIPVILVTSVLARLLVDLVHQVPPSPLPATGVAAGVILQLIAGAVVAPIAEEAVFRGFAISAWLRTVGETGALVRASRTRRRSARRPGRDRIR